MQHWAITIKKLFFFFTFLFPLITQSSIDDYLYSDIGVTSNIHGEIGLINIPNSRILKGGNLKLHLVNSDPINSMFISANPYDWMEVSLRYADINTIKYSPFKSFSGDQTYKDKSFNLKLRLIQEQGIFPELSLGFRDFIGTGKFSGEYIVSSKKIGDFDFTVGLGWGAFSNVNGIKNPFIDISEDFINRIDFGETGTFGFNRWFKGRKASAFYGFEYINKYSGLRFKLDYDSSNPFNLRKKSDYSFGISIPASKYLDINLFRHRGSDLGFGISYKANYSKSIVPKNEIIPFINFNDKDTKLIKTNDEVFTGTLNVLLSKFGIYTQEIFTSPNYIEIVVDQDRYRNINIATKRVLQLSSELLKIRDINSVRVTFQTNNIRTQSVDLSLEAFESFLDNKYSISEFYKSITFSNYTDNKSKRIFIGEVDYPVFSWGIRPDLKNHVGAPENFYSGQLGLYVSGGLKFQNNSYLESTVSLSLFQNLDQLRLSAYSRLPKVRSDVREYLKEKYVLKDLAYSHIFKGIYTNNFLLFGGIKIGLFEEMYGGVGGEFLFRDVNQPWYLTANYYWVKQREFNQRFSFRDYETFTGHLNFIWETPLEGTKLILSAGRYLAKDNGVTINLSRTFKSGFVLGFYATKTDISSEEFGEGSFDKGIFFSIPLDLVSSRYRKSNARFVWKNLTRDGGAMLSGGLDLGGYVENTSSYFLKYYQNGLYE